MHRSCAVTLMAALLTVAALPAAQAQDNSSLIVALPDAPPSNEVSLTADFTGGVGTQADPGGGSVIIQMLPATDTGISNAPSDFHYVRQVGH